MVTEEVNTRYPRRPVRMSVSYRHLALGLESDQTMCTYSRSEVSKFLLVNRGGIPYLANISTPQHQQTSTAGSVACGWENLSKFLSACQFINSPAHRKLSSLRML